MAGTSKVAGGNISPSRFVKLDTGNDGKALQCGAGEMAYGISGPDVRNFPYGSLDDGYHAVAGTNCRVFGLGERCWLELGGTVTPGVLLKSNADGKGVAVSANNDFYGAVSIQGGVAGDLIEVEVRSGYYGV